jgi:hypothetical protein
MFGYIDLRITTLVYGNLLFIDDWKIKPKVLTNAFSLTRDFVLGGLSSDS